MKPKTCLACERQAAFPMIVLTATCKGHAREWRLQVCRECWQSFEALVEVAAAGIQPELVQPGRRSPWWFV